MRKKSDLLSLVRNNHLFGENSERLKWFKSHTVLWRFVFVSIWFRCGDESVPTAMDRMIDTFVQWNMKIRSMLSLNESKMHCIRFVLSIEWAIDHCTGKCAFRTLFTSYQDKKKLSEKKKEKTDGRIEANSVIFHCASINGLSETCTRRFDFYCTFLKETKGEATTTRARTHTHTIHTNAKDWP